MRECFDDGIVGHVQVSSVPLRHEPDTGELNFEYVCAQLDDMGYGGWVGAEYNPAGDTEDGLGWFAPYRNDSKCRL